MHSKFQKRKYIVVLMVFAFWISGISAESGSFQVSFSIQKKRVENVEERPWNLGPITGYPYKPDGLFPYPNMYRSNFYFPSFVYANFAKNGYLEQRMYRTNIVEPGVSLQYGKGGFTASVYAGIRKSVFGEYGNSTSPFCGNGCLMQRNDFDIARIAFGSDSPYRYKVVNIDNNDELYSESGKVVHKGFSYEAQFKYAILRLDRSKYFLGTGLTVDEDRYDIFNFQSFDQNPARAVFGSKYFLFPGDGIIGHAYRLKQVPFKLIVDADYDFLNLYASVYYILGRGNVSTSSVAPGLPVFQRSDSVITGDGWGFDFGLSKNISKRVDIEIAFKGKRFYASGKDRLHGAYDYAHRLAQEVGNTLSRRPTLYFGYKEQGVELNMKVHY